jgi:hypothetical protein
MLAAVHKAFKQDRHVLYWKNATAKKCCGRLTEQRERALINRMAASNVDAIGHFFLLQ